MIPVAENESKNQTMSITIGPDQLIKFPTITKLTYDGTNSHLNKTQYRNSTRSIIKSTSPVIPAVATNSFRVIEVAPDDNIIKICMMSIHGPDQKHKTAPRQYRNETNDITKRSMAMAILRKQRSQSLLSNINYSSSRAQNQTIKTSRTAFQSSHSKNKELEQQRKKSKTQSLIKLKLNFRGAQSKLNIQQIYMQVIKALALFNSKAIITQSTNFQRIKRAKIEKGNNGYMVKQTVKKRNWWNITEDIKQANFVWTQRTLKNLPFNEEKEPFYTPISQQEQKSITFQRNIDQALIHYPKMLQLFFLQVEINKIMNLQMNQNYKIKKPYTVYSFLTSLKPIRKIHSEQVIIYNHVPNNFEITSKKMLYKNLWKYYHEQKIDPYQSIPKTYHLTIFDWQQKIQFIKSEQKCASLKNKQGGHDAWFLKPGQNTNRGRGIQMFNETSAVLDHIIRNPPKSVNKTYILQEYIDPLLYEGRKFDIRCYMLCVQAFECQTFYWYQQGYIRTSSSKFTMSKTSVSIHLTNDAVQKEFNNYDKYESANKLSYLDIDKYLKNQYGFDFLVDIIPKMKKITTDVCKAAADMGTHKNTPQQEEQCEESTVKSENYPALYFEIFGLDFIISKTGSPFLLQVNTNPCLQINSNLLSRVIPEMIENTFRLVSDVYLPNKTGTPSVGLCPDWAQSFILNNKFSLMHRREILTKETQAKQMSEGI